MFIFYYPNQVYFEIPEFKGTFYIIPKDKGGKNIVNQDKKGLHLSNPSVYDLEVSKDPALKFSIQVYTSDNYEVIKNEINSMINVDDTIFTPDDLYVAVLKHNFGHEFFLLYKNFISHDEALDYCNKYAYFLDNCIIVNVQNLE